MRPAPKFGVSNFLNTYPPKAAQLIVTIYGDIVEPRGGVLWMGDLISLCSGFGVNESLVRTAVSRLVSKDQLSGQREGRRSFYGLTSIASAEFHSAADLFFGPADDECEWLIVHCPHQGEQLELTANGFAPLGGGMYIAADRPGRPLPGTSFRSVAINQDSGKLKELLHSTFGLEALSIEYADIVLRMKKMKNAVNETVDGQNALLLRLALVHAYRNIRLRDPRLPVSALPDGWPGAMAHRLFADVYGQLSFLADTYIGEHLLAINGPLPAQPPAVQSRLKSLAERS
jgi:phenylacetic acid degradation operon negative regulatory protein